MLARNFLFASEVRELVVRRGIVVASDANFGLEPDLGVGRFDDCAVFQSQRRCRPMQAAKVDGLAEIDDPAEVNGALRHALGEDLKAADGTLERMGLDARSAAGRADVNRLFVEDRQLPPPAEVAHVLAGEIDVDGGIEVFGHAGHHLLEGCIAGGSPRFRAVFQ